jgi:hypothetical protein
MTAQGPSALPTSRLELDAVHVLTAKGAPILERTRAGRRAFAGADLAAACRLLAALTDADPQTRIERFTTRDLVAWLCASNVEELTLAGVGGDTNYAVVPDAPAVDACPLVMVVDAGDRPGREPEAGYELFRLRRERVMAGEISPLALDSWLAFDQDVYVPCHPEMLAREMWPRFQASRGPKGEHLAAFEFFTTIEAAAKRAGSGGRVMAMGGRDALRWAFAAPIGLESVVVDPGQPTEIALGRGRVLSILFPATLPFEDQGNLPALELSDLTAFMPIDASLGIVSGTLLRHWRDLIGPSGPARSKAAPCGFTTQNAFVTAMSSQVYTIENAVSPSEHPPFRQWLTLARESGSVVLDPCSPAPLVVDVPQLFLLAHWAESKRSIEPEEFVTDLGREERLGHLSDESVARIVAGWPTWFVGDSEDREGMDTRPWIATAGGELALFSSERRLQRFVADERGRGRLRAPWRSRTQTQTAGANLFELARREYSGVVVDPGQGDVALRGARLELALAEVQTLLWPRHLRPQRRAA